MTPDRADAPSRREVLGLGAAGALAAAGVLAGCAPVAQRLGSPALPDRPVPPARPAPARRIAERVGFGARPGGLAELESTGYEAWIAAQLRAEAEDPAVLTLQLARLDALRIDGFELRDEPPDAVIRQIQRATLLRAVYSPNQLRERLADQWINHLNVYARKGHAAYRLAADVERVVRPHALGSFPAMIRGSSRSPAMLAYLDNTRNTRQGPNENYARELMELHAMGVDGGYTQRDIREVARCFTGWTLENRFLRRRGSLVFNPALHDDGEKVVLGQTIPAGGGESDAARVVDLILAHPAVARHVARRLATTFLGDPDAPEVRSALGAAEAAYTASGGQIRATLAPLLRPEVLVEAPPIAKRPFDYVASCLRATGASTDGGPALQAHLDAMGQPLHEWPMPDGFPTETAAWTGSMLARWNFAEDLVAGGIRGTSVPLDRIAGAASPDAVGGVVPIADAARDADPRTEAFLALCQPEFMWR